MKTIKVLFIAIGGASFLAVLLFVVAIAGALVEGHGTG